MRNSRLVLLVLALGCGGQSYVRPLKPERAPADEAARFTFPIDLPADGRMRIPADLAAAISLAMDDFRPRGVKPHRGATPDEVCLYQRESFDVTVAPGPEGVVFVRFTVKDGACDKDGPVADMGSTYAVEVAKHRILAIQRP
ncbi:hypothetical protein SAMN04488504_101872 [Myxococcus virescens]|uniref:Lipoprotein n=2 Tax=Myxococcus virescens TaxID=83456 RepID=A0ABY0MJH3_9BACT|nr:hypothetical protein SAMN04488504_101872 [Myxococcus virescens]